MTQSNYHSPKLIIEVPSCKAVTDFIERMGKKIKLVSVLATVITIEYFADNYSAELLKEGLLELTTIPSKTYRKYNTKFLQVKKVGVTGVIGHYVRVGNEEFDEALARLSPELAVTKTDVSEIVVMTTLVDYLTKVLRSNKMANNYLVALGESYQGIKNIKAFKDGLFSIEFNNDCIS